MIVTEKLYRYQPKGGMCQGCLYKGADCSDLDFMRMPVELDKYWDNGINVIIVKCTKYQKFKPDQP